MTEDDAILAVVEKWLQEPDVHAEFLRRIAVIDRLTSRVRQEKWREKFGDRQ